MKRKSGTIEVFYTDKEKIKQLVQVLVPELGGKVSQRMAIMFAVNKLLKEFEDRENQS